MIKFTSWSLLYNIVVTFTDTTTVISSTTPLSHSLTRGLTNKTDTRVSSGSTVQISTNGSNISKVQGLTNGTSPNASHNYSYITTILGDGTVTRTIANTSKVAMLAFSQITEELSNQTYTMTYIGHVTEVTVHPISGHSSSFLDKSSRIAIGSSIAGLVGVLGIVALVVYRLDCIGKKIIPVAAR